MWMWRAGRKGDRPDRSLGRLSVGEEQGRGSQDSDAPNGGQRQERHGSRYGDDALRCDALTMRCSMLDVPYTEVGVWCVSV